MAFEVELKAHVQDPQAIMAILEGFEHISEPVCEYKQDIYYAKNEGEEPLFRLRRESFGPDFDSLTGSVLFTYKEKTRKDGIEVNVEKEFTTSDSQGENAEQFFLALGYVEYIKKTKKGYSFVHAIDGFLPMLHIELAEVKSLGWFLEMEFLIEDPSLVAQAKEKLLEVLHAVGLGDSTIESRYYMHMLKDKDI
ncbi:adenylate cyclase, class 2 (thermophilic) [Sphaerochaeta pleomorpha str. Grapes]|uniref:Adenylate cyclase, class 2 (Thermophilic) n=1 Tax=Sphaerochaeta pleomorpha (strain ATCC BAA-1885 / DSM 22778 / Grapes) TaxID=158190 RepID=G8QUY1_SPHPG|nr:CYTH domain-containing protein [Sphaerochaeta pleomorpha]AEV28157.1 adenylate cyclase, class 2 (thermophilic) [Sphaerochaeta pleomorpha str. Grapes]